MPPASGSVSFGPFELDLGTGELRKSGGVLKLRPQPGRILCLLVSQAGNLVSREEIQRRIWGESTYVDYKDGVDYCVNRIRSALCDDARAPRYVETLPRRGYRFIAPVKRQRPFAEPTLAVLPFANLNGDPAREYFADGVTDALITQLARIQAVRVISRQSVLHLKGSSRKLDEIARELGVDGIVEGAALHEGSRVRVTAQLILMEPERHVWAQSYDCDMSAVLSTQRDAAQAIAGCVATALMPGGAVTAVSAPSRPVAPEIVEHCLKARAELGRMSAEGLGKALQYLREITLKAPDFALGLAWYSGCLVGLGYWGHAPIREVYPSAKQLALNALAIDDSVDVAHLTLGMVNWLLDWDLAAAERDFRRAIELSPSNPDAHIYHGIFLSHINRLSEATTEALYALKLDPVSLIPRTAVAWIYLAARRYEKAEDQSRQIIESFPDSLHAHFVLGWAAWCQHRGAEAVAAFEKAFELSHEAFSIAFLGHVYGQFGRIDQAKRLLRQLEQLLSRGQAPQIALALVDAGLGDADAAFGRLETAYRLRDEKLFWLTATPMFDVLRPDPRYARLVDRMGLAVPSLDVTS
jgi:TolB-like protein/tetratricopeptide (TPR) repeat protein